MEKRNISISGRGSSTHCVGGWVCPRAGLDVMEKRKISVCVENRLQYPLCMRLGGPRNQPECYGEEKNLFPLPGIKP
jgi:hypothetical protein